MKEGTTRLIKSETIRIETDMDDASLQKWSNVIGNNYFPFSLKFLSHRAPGGMTYGICRMRNFSICKIEMSGGLTATGWRSWSMIRQNNMRIFIFWFTLVGHYEVYQSNRSFIANDVNFAMTRSDVPFRMSVYPDENGNHLSYQIVIPVSSLYASFPEADSFCSRNFTQNQSAASISRDIVRSVYESSDLSDIVAEHLIEVALESIVESVRRSDGSPYESDSSSAASRMRDVLRMTDHCLTDPNLTPRAIATKCGLSVGYLHRMFKGQGTTFTTYVYDKRLERARELLVNEQFLNLSIGEISYIAGFNSHSHFDRLFLRKYGMRPSEARSH